MASFDAPPNCQSLSWHGAIPCSISLSPHDLIDIRPTPPHFLMLPRMSYMHVAAKAAVDDLQKLSLASLAKLSTQDASGNNSIDAGEGGGEDDADGICSLADFSSKADTGDYSNVWFSHNNKPLDWQLPIGVLFDRAAVLAGLSGASTTKLLPLDITVHFSGYPPALLAYRNIATVRGFFSQSLKQSLFLEHGNAKVANNLSKAKSEALWEAVAENDFAKYAGVNDSIMADVGDEIAKATAVEDTRTEEEKERDDIRSRLTMEADARQREEAGEVIEDPGKKQVGGIRNIPVRVVSAGSGSITQRPVGGDSVGGNTLRDVLRSFCFPSEPEEEAGGKVDGLRACVNGLYDVPLGTPIAELWRSCQSADHFLYIIVNF
jgi:hypothetical protein